MKKQFFKLIIFLITLIIMIVFQQGTIYSQDTREWTKNALMAGDTLKYVTWGNNMYVAVGGGGTIMTSQHGIVWDIRYSGNYDNLHFVIWAQNKFIAFGNAYDDSSTLLVSTDAVNWTVYHHVFEQVGPQRIALNGILFVGVGGRNSIANVEGDSNIYTSTDGINWSQTLSPADPEKLIDIIWDGNNFIAVGSGGVILISDDGLNWTGKNSDSTGNLAGIAYDGNVYAIIENNPSGTANILYSNSPTLDEWQTGYIEPGISNSPFIDITWGKDKFIATTLIGIIYYSLDGITWLIALPTGVRSEKSYMVTYGDNEFVLAGIYGTRMTSLDGINWTRHDRGERYFQDVASDGNIFVAITSHGLKYLSDDGVTWDITNTSYIAATSVTWIKNHFIISGKDGNISRSADGITWSTGENIGVDENLNAMAWDGNTYVVVGDNGLIYISADCITWTEISRITSTYLVTPSTLTDIAWGNGIFAVTKYGIMGEPDNPILISSDGITWEKAESGTPNGMCSITWTGSQFIAVGTFGTVLTSPDGRNWENVSSSTESIPAEHNILNICYSNGICVAGTNIGGIYTSDDGIRWRQSNTGISEIIKGVASNGPQLIAVASCSILRNTSLLPQILCGDVDSGNIVSILDALLVAQYYVGLPVAVFNTQAADVNSDGIINIVDALAIAQYYVGFILSLSC